MAIIKRKTKSGTIYCYDSTPKWNPDLKQARPEITYLGRWDEETQSIIPTTGTRGSKKKETAKDTAGQAASDSTLQEYQEKVSSLQRELAEAKTLITKLSKENREYAAAISGIRKALEKIE